MTSDLDRLCEERGIELSYISETGEHVILADDVKRALLETLGDGVDASVCADEPLAKESRCFIPGWLRVSRAWGVTVQLFGVRSARNHGIGDFEDVARLCELLGPFGADFLGINPVHALFLADPTRTSPYSPSTRRYLNPLNLALDKVEGAAHALSHDESEALRSGDHVDYAAVTDLKRRALEHAFALGVSEAGFEAFCNREGRALDDFATFEVLSEWFAGRGYGAGWHTWPETFHSAQSDNVLGFRHTHAQRVRFHKWLQWLADKQLADAQRRARAAGMRIGLYLDLAVGVAPDGAATWAQPRSYASQVRVGAPPDAFNSAGQDWGLSPMRPQALCGTEAAFGHDLAAAMRWAGAVRLDHAMGLKRLYWIPADFEARAGGYIRYPLERTLKVLAELSQEKRVIVIGEDLGTVPAGFRDIMERAGLLGYRVFYFEREDDGRFRSPRSYTTEALACVSTHDLPPFQGWWDGGDIAAREGLGKLDAGDAAVLRNARGEDRNRLLKALTAEALVPDGDDTEVSADDILTAVHVFLARTPCRLCAVQLEDLCRATEQVNMPGTHREYRNWSLRLPLTLEELADDPLVLRTLGAVARERPKVLP
ncbi:MAG TPA: 4-alpha-glucanotransferase [Hyphomicrobium sp.]|nr:4-alpha-glucanotransferase [Hyphomicrobium sp.]